MSFRWNLALGIVICLVGIGMFFLFLLVSPAGWKSISLLFVLAFILSGIFRLLNFFFISLPEGHCNRLASSVGIFSAGLFYILHGQSIVWIALSWILLLWGIWGSISALQGILIEGKVLQSLLKAYKKREIPNLPMPFIYVLAEPGFGVYLGHRLITKTICSLAKHRYFPAESKLHLPRFDDERDSFLWKYRRHIAMSFLVSDSIRRYPISFRKWLASQAAAFMVVHSSLPIAESLVKTFNNEATSGYQICPGPTFTIYIRHNQDHRTLSSVIKPDQNIEYIHGIGGLQFDTVIAPLVNRLASTAFPISVSDARLTKKMRPLIQEIATYALPPIADCYLRLRLAQSDVERFLSSLDCIESLIRCSVIVLLANRWSYIGTDVSNKQLAGRPPTLGDWINLLQKLTTIVVPNELDRGLCAFWKGDMFQVQAELINEVNKTGLPLADSRRSNQLDWLEWFRDLRNVTRGHGVVEEKSVAPLWHFFHQTILELISALQPLILSSILVATEPNGKQVSIQGWYKGKNRTKLKFQDSQEHPVVTALKLPSGQLLQLYPLVIVHSNNVFVWDRLRKEERAIEFLNYVSWERKQLAFSEFSDSDPYKIWEKVKDSETLKEDG
jgi:aryl carrier-like protein